MNPAPTDRPRDARSISLVTVILTSLIPLFALFSRFHFPSVPELAVQSQSQDLAGLTSSFYTYRYGSEPASIAGSRIGQEGIEVESRAGLGEGRSENGTPPRALLLTAHPDDEVMFFAPTILGLIENGWELSGLCLSSGNSSGLGETRKGELVQSYQALGVSSERIKVIDHPDLEDSMTSHWDPVLVSSIVEEHLNAHPVDFIITFDEKGITNHPNHVALPHALPLSPTRLTSQSSNHNPGREGSIRVLYLISPSTLPKFTGPFYPIYLRLQGVYDHWYNFVFGLFIDPTAATIIPEMTSMQKARKNALAESIEGSEAKAESRRIYTVISSPGQWLSAVQAMMYHRSQLVWFRYLYLAASRLLWVNELVEV